MLRVFEKAREGERERKREREFVGRKGVYISSV